MKLFELLFGALLLMGAAPAADSWRPDWKVLKPAWRARLQETATAGRLPIIDLENSYSDGYMNAEEIRVQLEKRDVVLVAWSPEESNGRIKAKGAPWWSQRWREMLRDLTTQRAAWTIPVPPGRGFDGLQDVLEEAEAGGYPMLGEFFFRHYPSDHDLEKAWSEDDANVPIDGPFGVALFEFSSRTGKPFQIHYEVEDALLAPLESMLSRYPKAKVIWCHAGRVRKPERAPHFFQSPAEAVDGLLARHPNLYFDLSSLGLSLYPGNGKPDSQLWDRELVRMRGDWENLIAARPWRFVCGLDTGMDRGSDNASKAGLMGRILSELPPEVRPIVAYKAAWKLLFNETL